MSRLSIFVSLLLGSFALAKAPPPLDSPATLRAQPTTKPVPFLTADEALAQMHLDPRFRMEVVASEPMVEHPIAIAFDAIGRMWVVEMRSYHRC